MKTLLIFAGFLAIISLTDLSDIGAQEKVTNKSTTGLSNDEAKILIFEGKGIEGVRLGKSLMSDVTAKYGDEYKLIEHKKYSYELRYQNGLSFFYCHSDRRKKIVALRVTAPLGAITLQGVVLGLSTVRDVFDIYGAVQPLTSTEENWMLRYNKGVTFLVKFDSMEDPKNLQLFLQRKIIAIEIQRPTPFSVC